MKNNYSSNIKTSILLILVFIASGFTNSANDTGYVTGVTDGDTIYAAVDGRNQTIRLYGIDSPEKNQAFGQVAKRFTSELVYQKHVRISAQASKDKYGRTVADVYVNDTIWLNYELVKAGMAWHWAKYSSNPKLAQAMEYAKKNKRGLWNDLGTAAPPVAPWEYRSMKKYQGN